MLSEYSKGGLTVNVLDWYGPAENCYLKAEVIFGNEKTTDDLTGPLLTYVLKRADAIGFSFANGDPQQNFPHKYYAEAYYEIIS